jgi:hypothetical protein
LADLKKLRPKQQSGHTAMNSSYHGFAPFYRAKLNLYNPLTSPKNNSKIKF